MYTRIFFQISSFFPSYNFLFSFPRLPSFTSGPTTKSGTPSLSTTFRYFLLNFWSWIVVAKRTLSKTFQSSFLQTSRSSLIFVAHSTHFLIRVTPEMHSFFHCLRSCLTQPTAWKLCCLDSHKPETHLAVLKSRYLSWISILIYFVNRRKFCGALTVKLWMLKVIF